MSGLKFDDIKFSDILGAGFPSAINDQQDIESLNDTQKKRVAVVAALELIRNCSSDQVDLANNLDNLDSYRDKILAALGENVQ
ncbi:hypothetical protein [Endozoicomonas sp.]|uniref:hypothetical protein n=1 Tax=Endozoicomonas sp. TaxID=1892382 RepID=UPI002888C1F2|nr:hypothetical protein [Endozoicomonas sp.]